MHWPCCLTVTEIKLRTAEGVVLVQSIGAVGPSELAQQRRLSSPNSGASAELWRDSRHWDIKDVLQAGQAQCAGKSYEETGLLRHMVPASSSTSFLLSFCFTHWDKQGQKWESKQHLR